MSPTLYRAVDDWLDGSLDISAVIAVSALIAVIIAGVLAGLAVMTVRRTNMIREPGRAPRTPEHHQGSPGASSETRGDGQSRSLGPADTAVRPRAGLER